MRCESWAQERVEGEGEEGPFGANGLVGVGKYLGEDAEDGRDRDGFRAKEAVRGLAGVEEGER